MLSIRPLLVLGLACATVGAHAQTDAEPPLTYTQVMLAPTDAGLPILPTALPEIASDALPAPVVLPASTPAAAEVPAEVPLADASLIATVVAEPAPVEDPVQLRMPRAPVRMELAQNRRRVVLLPGVSRSDRSTAPDASEAVTVGHVTYSRAVVVVSEGGRREVRFMDTNEAATLNLGTVAGCDGAPLDVAMRLRGLRATPLRRGMRGEAVEAAQHLLCAAGQDIEPDGRFDRQMDADLRAFQRSYNAAGLGPALVVDGALGPKTRKALDVMISARTNG